MSDVPTPERGEAARGLDPISIDLAEEIVEAHRAGLTVAEIAGIYNVDPRRVDALVVAGGPMPGRRPRWLKRISHR